MEVESFRTFFDASPDALIVINNKGVIEMASKRAMKLFGYEYSELVGKTVEDLMPVDFYEIHKKHREVFNTNPQTREMGKGLDLIARRKDGTVFYAEISISPVKTEAGHITLASVRDVTEKRELFNQHKISSEQFRGAFEYSAIGMALVSTEGKWLKANKQLCEIVGYTEDELQHKTFQDITHPDDLNLDLEHVGEMLRGEIQSYQMEKRYFHKNGSIVWVLLSVSLAKDAEGNPLHFVSQVKDITARKKTEEALKESEQRWQFALEGAGDGIWDWNAQTNVVFFSKRWKAMLGYEDHEVKGSFDEWQNRLHPDDRERSFKLLDDYFTRKSPVYVNEHRLLCKDGTYKWILARGKVLQWTDDGQPIRVIGTHTDISQHKQKESELSQSFDIISEQNKRLMNFAHIVSHNLRSHAGNFQLILNLLENADDEEEREQMVRLLKENSLSLTETIKHLNEVVQIQANVSIKKVHINLKNYIDKTTDILSGEINQHHATVINNVPADFFIEYNPAYMESILLNFITNGIKYRHAERNPDITLDILYADGKPVLQVADNGMGINLEKYGQKLFGLYKTFHGNSDAKGVGLFITRNQVEAMGGHIEVESRIGAGTTFKIYLQ